jgi:hypothetical protein
MTDHDPPPLSDPASGAPPFLRAALRSARAEVPDAHQLARLAGKLPLAGPVAPPAAPPSVLSGALIGAALGVLVAGAGFVRESRREAGAPVPPVVAAVTAPRIASATAPVLEAPRTGTEAARAVPVPAPSPPVPVAATPASVSASAIVPPPPPAPSEASPPPVAGAVPGASLGGGQVAREELHSEVELLGRARDSLASNPAEALALTRQSATQFPGGALAQEREVLAIEALRRLGRLDEARARRDRFLSAYPGSVHRQRLEATLGP